MDRRLYKLPFSKLRAPDWVCPTCRKGILRLVKGSLRSSETRQSSQEHDHPAWEPDWIRLTYSCVLKCNNDQCKEVVSNVGTGGLDFDVIYEPDGRPVQDWEQFYRPKYFEPPLSLIDIPEKCPAAVHDPLQGSFRLFFCSPPAASNGVRMAVEALLTELGVKRYVLKNSERKLLNLHTRIGLLPSKYIEIQDMLFAVKWLGNAGSHTNSTVTLDDVMDAYELMDYILRELYVNSRQKAKTLAKRVNKKKGPAR